MSRIRGRDTIPEVAVRKALFAKGFRYRVCDKRLPGAPDLVFTKYRAVVFTHGCFWHGHGCHLFKWPKGNPEFWKQKLEANRTRDARTEEKLWNAGWRVGVIWECALRGARRLQFEEVIEQCSGWLQGEDPSMTIKGKAEPV